MEVPLSLLLYQSLAISVFDVGHSRDPVLKTHSDANLYFSNLVNNSSEYLSVSSDIISISSCFLMKYFLSSPFDFGLLIIEILMKMFPF